VAVKAKNSIEMVFYKEFLLSDNMVEDVTFCISVMDDCFFFFFGF
jgi:hypothetical protein